jgi:ABC-type sugar transport system ATPase subunit/ribose/xylose/arabinose/galactoside ABC-type transport system permease subunit
VRGPTVAVIATTCYVAPILPTYSLGEIAADGGMSAVIELAQVVRTFPGVVALDDVSLALQPGRVHALLGENGAGKSTLIHVLGGSLTPDRGEVRLDGRPIRFHDAHDARRCGIVTVHQEVDLFADLSVQENIGLEQGLPTRLAGWIDQPELRRRCRDALAIMQADLAPDAPAWGLSPAQRQLLLLGAALSRPARVLILDEPTSSLSAAESETLFGHVRRLRDEGAAILYVSHRFEEIFALADEATVLRDGRRVWHGPLAETSPQQLLQHMVGRDSPPVVHRAASSPGQVLLRCADLSAADGSFAEITLEVQAGEVLGIYGLVGAGRSEWAQAILGLRPLAGGEVWLDGKPVVPAGPGPMARLGIAYVPEDRLRQGLCRGLTVRANLVLAMLRQIGGLWRTRAPEAARTWAAVETLRIRLRSIEQAAGTLSGGNQQKVVLGRWLERRPRVLLLDEPTRGIDVAAKAEIHALVRRLADKGLAIILISSELPEVLAQSDRIGVFRGGRLAGMFDPRTASAAAVAAVAMPAAPALDRREAAAGRPRWRRSILPLRELVLAILLLALLVAQQAVGGEIMTASALQSLAKDTALLTFCALGAAMVLLAGGIDISLGSQMALSAGLAGWLWEQGHPLALVLPVTVVAGALCGCTNAVLSLVGRVHPIVVTLGTLSLYRGLLIWRMEQDVQIPSDFRGSLLTPILGLPPLGWIGLVLGVVAAVFLRQTATGREVYAVGSNAVAAQRAGISPARVWLIAFTLQGALAGLAGLLYLADSGNLQPVSYEDKTLEAIAAAVVGGVSLSGGRGTVLGVVLGCAFLVALPPACQHLHLPRDWQRAFIGAVMVLAVTLDALWRRRGS